uniref:Putative secreted protein n=1 Tax=Ixodes ricinus TaxID=34613 RepID=A0A6B0UIM9_IXORI
MSASPLVAASSMVLSRASSLTEYRSRFLARILRFHLLRRLLAICYSLKISQTSDMSASPLVAASSMVLSRASSLTEYRSRFLARILRFHLLRRLLAICYSLKISLK